MEFVDQLNRTINLSNTPERIVSLVPSQTELLVDLGLRDSIVGITKFCIHPKNLRKQKTVVGGTKAVNYDKIRALNPDIIICNKEENTENMVLQLEKIAPVWISDIFNISDCIEMIDKLGRIFQTPEHALQIGTRINTEWQNFKLFAENLPLKKVAYLIWKDPYMAAGRDNFINQLLELNKFENIVVDEDSRYPEIPIETLQNAEMILLSTEPFPFKEKHILEFQQEFNIETKLVDGEYFSWYGSRMKKAFEYFKTLH